MIKAETHVERENLSEIDSNSLTSTYDLRLSHRHALEGWLKTFYNHTQPDGGRPPPPKLALAPTDDDIPVVEAINAPLLSSGLKLIRLVSS